MGICHWSVKVGVACGWGAWLVTGLGAGHLGEK